MAGSSYSAEGLAALLNRQGAILRANEGGVTFTGGEPLQQAGFVAEVIDRLDGLHVLLDTSGHGRYAKIDYRRICNGGPITLELSDTVFRNPESIHQAALLVRAFAQLGGQQFQLNSLSLETLLDARAHPERHKNLIVRVWGWSGYFCELTPEYQDHVIARHMYQL